MYLSGKPHSVESIPVQPQRAGLRVAPTSGQPTGIFEVIEMAVLVIVTALAMVSVIVASSEDDSRQRLTADATAEHRPATHDEGRRDPRPAVAPALQRPAVAGPTR